MKKVLIVLAVVAGAATVGGIAYAVIRRRGGGGGGGGADDATGTTVGSLSGAGAAPHTMRAAPAFRGTGGQARASGTSRPTTTTAPAQAPVVRGTATGERAPDMEPKAWERLKDLGG